MVFFLWEEGVEFLGCGGDRFFVFSVVLLVTALLYVLN